MIGRFGRSSRLLLAYQTTFTPDRFPVIAKATTASARHDVAIATARADSPGHVYVHRGRPPATEPTALY